MSCSRFIILWSICRYQCIWNKEYVVCRKHFKNFAYCVKFSQNFVWWKCIPWIWHLPKYIVTYWYIRVGWWISKVGDIGVKWKLLGIETAVVKGFFSKIIILDNKWLLKIAKKMRKCIFLFNGPELERVLVFRPPLFFDFRGGHTSSILSNSCSFLRYAFLGLKFIVQNNDFWEKSFYYSSFYA